MKTERVFAVPALLALALGCGACGGPGGPDKPDTARPNLLILSLDTLRRDHLPTYGYDRPTAPAIDAFARTAVVFEDAFSQEVNTGPSHACMFTGLYTHVHGGLTYGHPLPRNQVTLAEILSDSGYRTAAFLGGITMSARVSGLDQGFEEYDDGTPHERRPGEMIAARAVNWLESLEDDSPFFLLAHFFDAHGPYLPPAEYLEPFLSPRSDESLEMISPYQLQRTLDGRPMRDAAPYVDRYDAMIRYTDDRVAEILAAVDPVNTVIVIIADHGETLGERYWSFDHGARLFDEQIRIPLIVRAPGISPRRVAFPVETVDLLPTLLDLMSIERPESLSVQGRRLTDLMNGAMPDETRPVYSSARSDPVRFSDGQGRIRKGAKIHSVRTDQWKLIAYPGLDETTYELYDLSGDPMERQDVSGEHAELRDHLRALLDSWLEGAVDPSGTGELPDLPEDVEESLRSLGYVGG